MQPVQKPSVPRMNWLMIFAEVMLINLTIEAPIGGIAMVLVKDSEQCEH
jgi:hypothetical protein